MFRGAGRGDLAQILKIYAHAREAMKASGNPTQWGDNYPPQELLEEDIDTNRPLQGTPHAKTFAGTLRVTTLPAPITALSPIVSPGQMIAPAAIHTLLPIVIGAQSSVYALLCISKLWIL